VFAFVGPSGESLAATLDAGAAALSLRLTHPFESIEVHAAHADGTRPQLHQSADRTYFGLATIESPARPFSLGHVATVSFAPSVEPSEVGLIYSDTQHTNLEVLGGEATTRALRPDILSPPERERLVSSASRPSGLPMPPPSPPTSPLPLPPPPQPPPPSVPFSPSQPGGSDAEGDDGSPSIALIIGVAAGGSLGLAVAGVAWLYWRRSRRSRRQHVGDALTRGGQGSGTSQPLGEHSYKI